MPAESPATAHLTPVCPECGYRHDGPPGSPTPAMLRARLRIPRRITTIALLCFVVVLASTTRTSSLTSGPSVPMFLDPLTSYVDLQAIAGGSAAALDPSLSARFNRVVGEDGRINPGRRLIEVTFASGVMGATLPERRTRHIGWPAAWVSIYEYRSYSDPLNRTGLKKASTDPGAVAPPVSRYSPPFIDSLHIPRNPRFAWFGDMIRYQPPPEATGGVPTIYMLNLASVISSLGILVASWYIAAIMLAIVRRIRGSRSPNSRIVIPVVATLAVAAIMLVTTLTTPPLPPTPFLYASSGPAAPPPGTSAFRTGFTRLSLDLDRFRSLAGPEGDRTLAQTILNEVPEPPGPPEYTFLVAVSDPESRIAKGVIATCSDFFPLVWLSRFTYERQPGLPDTGPMERRIKSPVRYSGRMLNFTYSPQRTPPVIYAANFDIPRLASLILALWLLHRIARWTIILTQRAQLRSRARLHLCAHCRYPIPVPSA